MIEATEYLKAEKIRKAKRTLAFKEQERIMLLSKLAMNQESIANLREAIAKG